MECRADPLLTAVSQFKVYQNRRDSRGQIPFLLDVQSDLVETGSRLVVPLVRDTAYGVRFTRLNPGFRIDSVAVIAATSDLAAIDERQLGTPVADLSPFRNEITAALDFLIFGY